MKRESFHGAAAGLFCGPAPADLGFDVLIGMFSGSQPGAAEFLRSETARYPLRAATVAGVDRSRHFEINSATDALRKFLCIRQGFGDDFVERPAISPYHRRIFLIRGKHNLGFHAH